MDNQPTNPILQETNLLLTKDRNKTKIISKYTTSYRRYMTNNIIGWSLKCLSRNCSTDVEMYEKQINKKTSFVLFRIGEMNHLLLRIFIHMDWLFVILY